MLKSLVDKVAWVTGAGTGIGQAGAVALAKEGARVVLSGRRREPLLETQKIISKAGGEAAVEPLDVVDAAAVQGVVDRIRERYGRLDILVNNAGTNVTERHWDGVDTGKWDEVVDINLNGAFYCASAVLPIMRRQKDGLIINIASWAGRFDTYVTGPAYSAAKHGVVAMNASINIEEFVNGIRACVICPGEVWTPIIDRRPDALAEDVKAKMLRSEDLGETILFVARLPRHVCLNEILISPTWNRMYVNDATRPPVEEG
ncbi:MAG: SDR family oxidoreductase [Deltaproteobacteria bacterium]|nr:SDR family oxidoreductase [Deltaproteobacteria bacterium]MBW2673791.1 SDR family oxidoreductase [Deltaproteobacteria bacterium]